MDQPYKTTEEAVKAFEGQKVLQPGEPGWWKIWGASVRNIQTGDLVAMRGKGDEVIYHLISGTFEAKASGLRRGFISDNCEFEGGKFTLGLLCPIVLFRQETHNTLA